MAKARVSVKLSKEFQRKISTLGNRLVDDKLANQVGTMLVEESKRLISNGISPVRGVGRFEGYKNPEAYPGNKKPARPVNLSLTGTMLSYLNFKRNGQVIEFGIINAPAKVNTIARVHNTGEREDIPQRQFIPIGDDAGTEAFVPSITAKLRELFRRRVLEILGGSKK